MNNQGSVRESIMKRSDVRQGQGQWMSTPIQFNASLLFSMRRVQPHQQLCEAVQGWQSFELNACKCADNNKQTVLTMFTILIQHVSMLTVSHWYKTQRTSETDGKVVSFTGVWTTTKVLDKFKF